MGVVKQLTLELFGKVAKNLPAHPAAYSLMPVAGVDYCVLNWLFSKPFILYV
jgi:hypothetical protein